MGIDGFTPRKREEDEKNDLMLVARDFFGVGSKWGKGERVLLELL